MSDAPSTGGSSGIGFFVGFFAIIIFLAVTMDDQKGIFSSVGTSTPSYTETRTIPDPNLSYSNAGGESAPVTTTLPPPAPALTPAQVEDHVAHIYRELDNVREEVREATLREPASLYAGRVDLSIGSVYETDPEREYLTLRANSNNTEAIPISHWYLESYVTDERAVLPNGDRLMTSWRSPASENIVLAPSESAYLITGESPIDASFHENLCTGYLNDERDFYPSLSERCPYPMDEMKRFGDIKLDNDKCYDLVERISSCSIPTDELIDEANISGACLRFVENTFNYNDCVSLHRYDPYFERDGYWRIYLDERNELWRPEREIIRLMDENDRVIDVIEY
jgi:hypothetical protein